MCVCSDAKGDQGLGSVVKTLIAEGSEELSSVPFDVLHFRLLFSLSEQF